MEITLKEIENKLIQEIASILSRDKSSLAIDTPLHELGIDSLEFVEILVFIENTFELQLIESNLTKKDFGTIHSLACFINGKH
jgi:acyl carrier protein